MSEEEMGGEWNAITSLETLPKAVKEAEALIRKSEREREFKEQLAQSQREKEWLAKKVVIIASEWGRVEGDVDGNSYALYDEDGIFLFSDETTTDIKIAIALWLKAAAAEATKKWKLKNQNY